MNAMLHAAALAGLSLPLLSGCMTPKEKANCPIIAVLASTSSLTMFKAGAATDPAGELYTVQMTGAKTRCDFDADEGTTDSDIDLTFRATRAPSGDAANYTVPFYVASLVNGSTVIKKQILAVAFSFAPGEASVAFSQNIPSTVIHLDNGKKPYEYSLLTGLQLTREQLDFDKKTGRYAQ